MTNYRNGDQVLFETAATVVESGPDGITIQFGDIKLHTTPDTLSMVRRSIHVGDTVKHGDDKAFVSQTLEEGVFLIRLAGKTGKDAYSVVNIESLRHADEPVAPKPAVTAPVAAAAPTPIAETTPVPAPAAPAPAAPAPAPVGELLLDTPIESVKEDAPAAASDTVGGVDEADEVAEHDEGEAAQDTSGGVAAMAGALSSMIGRRRNLDRLGTTEEVLPVTATERETPSE